MTTTALKNRAAIASPSVAGSLTRVWETVQKWRERARSRRQLAEMSETMLADIGVSLSAARAEAGKPFWRA